MSFLEVIGALTIGLVALAIILVALELLREAVRAFRQSCRVARYTLGRHWRRHWHNRKFLRNFARQWAHQFGSGEFMIGCIVFPADPSKPFRRNWTA